MSNFWGAVQSSKLESGVFHYSPTSKRDTW